MSGEWTAGYMADVDYTYGYYTELNPLRMSLPLLAAGCIPPSMDGEFSACELGYGQGLSANIHAAASSSTWYGTDFNPAQAAFAQDLARTSGAKLYDQGFGEFCGRADLPDFDYIALHGIWSWISDANRKIITDFIHRKLKPGGVAYISYNTQPGWAAFGPLRDLLRDHTNEMAGARQSIRERIGGALDFADQLFAAEPLYARVNPHVKSRLEGLREHDPNYLAHEYFNQDWHPMPFGKMNGMLMEAKMSFACSATLLEHVDVINMTPEQRAIVDKIQNPVFRETVKDFCLNQGFRRDYWVKGLRRCAPLEQVERIRTLRFALATLPALVTMTAKGALGDANLTEAVYRPMVELLSDMKPRTFAEIEAHLRSFGHNFASAVQAVVILAGKGEILQVQPSKQAEKSRVAVDRINSKILEMARTNQNINFLASPMTGGGVQAGWFDQLFILARNNGKKNVPELTQFVWDILSRQGQKLSLKGALIESVEGNIAELSSQAEQFVAKRLPVFKALQVTS